MTTDSNEDAISQRSYTIDRGEGTRIAPAESVLDDVAGETGVREETLTRRNFGKLLGALGATSFLTRYKADVVEALEAAAENDVKLVWIQGLGDSACTVGLLQAADPDIYDAIEELKVDIAFNPTIMAEFGDDAVTVLEETDPDILVLEGSIPTGEMEIACTVGERDGEPVTFTQWVRELSDRTSTAIVGFGSCSSFGGIPAGDDFTGSSPTNAVGLYQFFERNPEPDVPIINIPGCPGHPDWLLSVLVGQLMGADIELDGMGRPRAYFSQLVHDNCSRRGAYDEGHFAQSFAESDFDQGQCLYKLGCRGPVTYAACSETLWNGGTSVCMDAGAPCIGCMHPGFPDAVSPFYERQSKLALDATATLFTGLTAGVMAGAAGYIGANAYKEWKEDRMEGDSGRESTAEESDTPPEESRQRSGGDG